MKIAKEPRLIEIKEAQPAKAKVIFVGDTHGDLEASQKVVKDYLKEENKIVFLGDYVDRGYFSKENLEFLIEAKRENPDQIFLLQGNHEGYPILKFSPANFWEGLSKDDYGKYWSIVKEFPLVFVLKDIIALHGALPDVKNLKEIIKIELGSREWQQIVWGDFVEEKGEYLGIDTITGRPKFGQDYFFKLMKRFKKKILIRSHDPYAPQVMFDNRCLTIFTSSAYGREREIAIFDLKKEIETAKDLEIKRI